MFVCVKSIPALLGDLFKQECKDTIKRHSCFISALLLLIHLQKTLCEYERNACILILFL